MTATRLRQIADRLEKGCSNYRKVIYGICIPCPMCHEAAEELRHEAERIGPKKQALAVNA